MAHRQSHGEQQCGEANTSEQSRNFAAQPVAEGPEHQGEQAERGDVGRGRGDGGDGARALVPRRADDTAVGEGEKGGVEPRTKIRQRPGDEAQTMRFTHPCALTALETADKVSP